MKHTLIQCDLCNRRIFRDEYASRKLAVGAIKISAKQLELIDDEFTRGVVYPQWKRRKYHICARCVKVLKKVCSGNPELLEVEG